MTASKHGSGIGDAMRTNHGKMPADAKGKRVHVVLRGGYATRGREPAGWAADGKGGCDWTLSQSPFSIVEWEIVT
jgi:hypothetical protein